MEEKEKEELQTEETTPTSAREVVETIIQNGVSKEELKGMLEEILKAPAQPSSDADVDKFFQGYIDAMKGD